jgi:hypothetical protein
MLTHKGTRHQPLRRATPQPRLPHLQQPSSLRRRQQQRLCRPRRTEPVSITANRKLNQVTTVACT